MERNDVHYHTHNTDYAAIADVAYGNFPTADPHIVADSDWSERVTLGVYYPVGLSNRC
jgi:hypothetical protein